MNLVDKVGGVRNAHKGTTGVDIVLPPIQFLVALERQVKTLLFRFENKAVWLKVSAFHTGYVT